MSIDSLFRAIGALACIYVFGLLVMFTSTAALNAAAYKPAALCTETSCAVTAHHHVAPSGSAEFPYSEAIHTAALFLAGE